MLLRLLQQLLGGLGIDRSLTDTLEAPDLKLNRWAESFDARALPGLEVLGL